MIPFLGHGEEGRQRGVKLALIAGIKESLYDHETLAKYLVWKLWRDSPECQCILVLSRLSTDVTTSGHEGPAYNRLLYPNIILPDTPLDQMPQEVDPHSILEQLADRLKAVQRGGFLDTDRAASYLVRWWRAGNHLQQSDTNSPRRSTRVARGWGFDFDFERPIEVKPLPSLDDAEMDPIQVAMDEEVRKYVKRMKEEDEGGIGISASMMRRNELRERKRKREENRRRGKL